MRVASLYMLMALTIAFLLVGTYGVVKGKPAAIGGGTGIAAWKLELNGQTLSFDRWHAAPSTAPLPSSSTVQPILRYARSSWGPPLLRYSRALETTSSPSIYGPLTVPSRTAWGIELQPLWFGAMFGVVVLVALSIEWVRRRRQRQTRRGFPMAVDHCGEPA